MEEEVDVEKEDEFLLFLLRSLSSVKPQFVSSAPVNAS